jgi:2'-5' RNA ligase
VNDPFLPEELRLFVACELPPEWLAALRTASRALARSGLGDLRWVRPEGIHLTLKFLGEVGTHLLPDLADAMVRATASQAPFQLTLSGLGSFGGRRGVRVLWAGVGGDLASLTALQARVDAVMSDLGFARELRPFSPHLTLARVPERTAPDTGARVVAALRRVTLPDVAPLQVTEISLIRSQLGPSGARYTPLTAAPLAG